MRTMKVITIALLLAFVWTIDLLAAPVELPDVQGQNHTLLAGTENKLTVLIFVSPYCPTSNVYTPEANRIAADYAGRVAFYFVEADADLSAADAQKHLETMELKAPALMDRKQVLARLTGATTTPEAVVLNTKGETLYQGRINDLYVSRTKKLKEPKTHDLRNALDAILAGREVETPRTKSIGCSITLTP